MTSTMQWRNNGEQQGHSPHALGFFWNPLKGNVNFQLCPGRLISSLRHRFLDENFVTRGEGQKNS
jgi:hypothetical protein